MTAVVMKSGGGGSKNEKTTKKSDGGNDDNSATVIAKRIKALLRVSPQDESLDAARLDELRRIFARQQQQQQQQQAMSSRSSSSSSSSSGVRQKWNRWLKQQQDRLIVQLQDRIQQSQQKSALRTFCGVIASSPILTEQQQQQHTEDGSGVAPRINEQLVHQLLVALVTPHNHTNHDNDNLLLDDDDDNNNNRVGMLEEELLQMLDMEFVTPHQDFKYYMLVAIREVSKSTYTQATSTSTTTSTSTAIQDEQRISAIAENLVRILLRIHINDNDKLILHNNNNNSNSNDGTKIGTMSHYLIPPPKQSSNNITMSTLDNDDSISSDKDEHDSDDDDDDDDDSDNDDSSSSEEEDDDQGDNTNNHNNKRKANDKATMVGGFAKKKKKLRVAADGNNNNNNNNNNHVMPYMRYNKHLRLLQEAWLELLKIPHLPSRALKLALQHLPIHVLPIVTKPLRFADFCIRAYDTDITTTTSTTSSSSSTTTGGSAVTSILALHSLYYLMLHHGLEYPKFYSSLYQLVTPHVFYAKHRTRFFKLLTNCLTKSQMLPGYLIAAFCKRLCRAALSAPPTGSLFVLALVSNLIRKHTECACLIHRTSTNNNNNNNNMMDDVFDSETNDPESCRALESSLWELNALERHYHPAVAALAKSCGTEDDKTPLYDIDEFMLHTYKSLFEQERKKGEIKANKNKNKNNATNNTNNNNNNNKKNNKKSHTKPIALTFQPPKSLFIKSNGQQDLFGSILSLPSSSPPKENE